jgi:hypothetical protein
MVSLVQNAIPQPMGVLSRVQAGVKEERIETVSDQIGETLHCSSSITHIYSSGIYKCICICTCTCNAELTLRARDVDSWTQSPLTRLPDQIAFMQVVS